MVVIDAESPLEEILPQIIQAGHSRFPVVGESHDDVLGILKEGRKEGGKEGRERKQLLRKKVTKERQETKRQRLITIVKET